MATATVHSVADWLANVLRTYTTDAQEVLAYHDMNGARVSLELTNGQRFFLSILEDDTD